MALTKITRGVIKANENYDTHNINSTGIVTAVSANFTGDVSIGGTLTYQDVTNIDSVGVITARNGLHVTGGNVLIGTTTEGYVSADDLTVATSGNTGITIRSGTGSLGTVAYSDGTSGDAEYRGYLQYDHNGDFLKIGTAGAEKVRIDSAGMVGINMTPSTTGNSTYMLQMYNAGSQCFMSLGQGSGNGPLNGLVMGVSNAAHYITGRENLPMIFATNDTERLRITSAGNIGVGTDNPDATLKVNVASGNNGVVVQNTSTANIALFGARNGDATVQIGQWGSTASGSTFGLSNADLSFIYTTSYSTTHPSALALGTVSNKPIVFATNNTERLRITSAGDVGIGTAVPITGSGYASLSLADTTGGQIEFKKFGAQTHYIWSDNNLNIGADYSGTGQNLIFKVNGNVERLRIDSNGNATFKHKVNIGDSHTGGEILSVGKSSGTSYMSFHTGGANMGFIGYADQLISGGASNELGIRSQDDIIFATGGNTERLRVASDGQVTFDKGAPGSANQVIARFQAESSRRLDIVWHDSGSLLGFDLPGSHSYIFKTAGTERLRITYSGGYVLKSYGRSIRYYTTTTNNSMYRTVAAISMSGNTAYEIRFTGTGNGITHAKCMASHWTSSYDLIRESYLATDSYSGMSIHDQINRTSGTQGAWSFSRPSNGQTGYQSHLVINKSAGSYGGGMIGCIVLEADRPYELLSIT